MSEMVLLLMVVVGVVGVVVKTGPWMKIPPPPTAELAETVLLLSVSVPLLKMPPPANPPVLAEMVLLFSVSAPSFKMPPPNEFAELAETVLLLSVSVPLLKIPPPPIAVLPEMVLLFSVSAPSLEMPPPPPLVLGVYEPSGLIAPPLLEAVLPEMVLLFSMRVPWLSMKPVALVKLVLSLKVRPKMVTVTPWTTRIIYPLLPLLIERRPSPGPRIIRSFAMFRSPLVSRMVPRRLALNVIVLFGGASSTA